MGDFVISLERFCGRVVQSNRSGRTRLVNTVEMSGKIAHTAHVQRTMLQREAPTLVISHQAESLPGCLTLRSARTVRIHNWTEAESSLLGPNDGVALQLKSKAGVESRDNDASQTGISLPAL
jgi:hypothetical protein